MEINVLVKHGEESRGRLYCQQREQLNARNTRRGNQPNRKKTNKKSTNRTALLSTDRLEIIYKYTIHNRTAVEEFPTL